MFTLEAGWWEIIVRTTIVYATVVAGFRVTGKRQTGQMSPFDLVIILLIANAVQNAMVGADVSVTGGVISAVTLLGLNFFVSVAKDKSNFVQRWVEGKPITFVANGKVDWKAMRNERVDREELEQALREHGLSGVENVKLATLEVDGTISIVPTDEHGPTA